MAAFLPSTLRTAEDIAQTEQDPQEVLNPGSTTTEGAKGAEGTKGTKGTTKTIGGGVVVPTLKGSCPDRKQQVPGDPYSPPCVAFSGSNGGATTRGVTAKEIVVSARILDEKGFQQTLAALAGAEITDEPDDIKRTITAFTEYFNSHFQFYGRKMVMKYYNGKGSGTTELLGGGQAEAQADAINVAQNIKAFAEINGASAPFADALARQKVIGFGTPYLSRKWHLDHRPWNWSIATDCSIVAETAGEYYVNLLAGKKASYAGGDMKSKTRVLAGLSPENPWYAECHDDFEKVIRDGGFNPEVRVNYRLDLNSMSNQAANVVAQLKSKGATSIFCGCDPIFPVFLTTKASEQNYFPEWVARRRRAHRPRHRRTADGPGAVDAHVRGQLRRDDHPAACRHRLPGLQVVPQGRAGVLGRDHLRADVHARARHPARRTEAHTADVRSGHAHVSGRHRSVRHVGLPTRLVHADA